MSASTIHWCRATTRCSTSAAISASRTWPATTAPRSSGEPTLQVKLLRVLEQRVVLPVGALRHRPLAARFLSATNRPLEMELAAGRFREDFYHRLNGISIVIPPLRDRPSEIIPLAERFVCRLSAAAGRPAPAVSPAARDALIGHHWPGNVRELRSVVELALALAGPESRIDLDHVVLSRRRELVVVQERSPAPVAESAPPLDAIARRASQEECVAVVEALERCGGNQTRAAQVLGLSRRQLTRRLDRLGIPRPRKGA